MITRLSSKELAIIFYLSPVYIKKEEISLIIKSFAGMRLIFRSIDKYTHKHALPANLPLAIMLVATSLMVLWEGPDEVTVVTKQAFSESQ